jgi:hypothetical protein
VNDRKKAFTGAVPKALTIKDSRFGLRKFPKNNEVPSVFSYSSPGKGPNGESSN